MATKSGSDTLSTLQIILDINEISKSYENIVSKHILLSIVSTMSDRAATQKKFIELLEDYRKIVLMEDLGHNRQNMTEKNSYHYVNYQICFVVYILLYILLKLHENPFYKYRKSCFDKKFNNGVEPGSVKVFSCGGDERSEVYEPFSIYV